MISLRVWMLTAIAEEQRARFLSLREVATQTGVALGTGVAGALVLVLGSGNSGYVRTFFWLLRCSRHWPLWWCPRHPPTARVPRLRAKDRRPSPSGCSSAVIGGLPWAWLAWEFFLGYIPVCLPLTCRSSSGQGASRSL